MRAQSAMPSVLSSTAVASCDLPVGVPDCRRLLELLALVPDPRRRRGVRHRLASVLAVTVAAVLAGCRPVLAAGEWAGEAPQELLGALGARRSPLTGRYAAPHTGTFGRVLRVTDAGAVDTVIGLFLAERAGCGELARGQDEREPRAGGPPGPGERPLAGALAVDGKAVRGARQADGRSVHLLSAMIHGMRAVVAQRDVAHKTNEIPEVRTLLAPLELAGWAVTLDAMHCQRETARFLVEDKGAAYVFTAVKDNQPGLFAALDALPWRDVPVSHVMRGRGHGREEARTIQVMDAPDGIWPHAAQVFLVERYVHDLAGNPASAVAALGLTALTAAQASPERLNHLVKGHWGIESLHWIRDLVLDEDRSQLRTGSAPQIMAGVRNLAIGALTAAGHTKIAPAMRWISRNPVRALQILGQAA